MRIVGVYDIRIVLVSCCPVFGGTDAVFYWACIAGFLPRRSRLMAASVFYIVKLLLVNASNLEYRIFVYSRCYFVQFKHVRDEVPAADVNAHIIRALSY